MNNYKWFFITVSVGLVMFFSFLSVVNFTNSFDEMEGILREARLLEQSQGMRELYNSVYDCDTWTMDINQSTIECRKNQSPERVGE